jgi:hypothetical protein
VRILAYHPTPSLTRERYDEVVRRLTGKERIESPNDLPFDGLLFHASGEGPDGFFIIDLFESEDAVQAFSDAMATIPREVGIEEPPEFPGLQRLCRSEHRLKVGRGAGPSTSLGGSSDQKEREE